ncbi:MAG: helix-turn-helix transcriptional regulator [Gammaproteobacteria bacterium]
MNDPLDWLRVRDICGRNRIGKTKLYGDIKAGLYPPPIKPTRNTAIWLHREDDAIRRAKIRGDTDEQIRSIVREVTAARAGV